MKSKPVRILRNKRKEAVEKLELKIGDTVLDLACGTGLNFPYLQETVGSNGRVVGFDCSGEMLSAARDRADKHGWKNIKLIRGDAAELSLDYQLNGVLSTLGISAILRHREALERAADLLHSDGRMSILDAQLFKGIWRISNPLIKPIYRYGSNWDYTKDIKDDLERILDKVEIEEYNSGTIYIATGINKR